MPINTTTDGVPITAGLWVWTNELKSRKVVKGPDSEGWYDLVDADGNRSPIMDGSRMAVWFGGLNAAEFQGMTHKDAQHTRFHLTRQLPRPSSLCARCVESGEVAGESNANG